MAVGLTSSYWMREISPIRERGPIGVTHVANLRPVRYVDDLGGLFDALRLRGTKSLLDNFAGHGQAGGRYDAVLMAVGVLIVFQMRRNLGFPTLLQKADFLQGFDLA